MIEAQAIVSIVAKDDAEVDAVYAALHQINRRWPETPVINITETSREVQD